jgi:taurine dioxygenase
MEDLFARGFNKHRGTQGRSDGWIGGRADTWHGHYRENPASRVEADPHRMAKDPAYAAEVATALREDDEAILGGNDALANAGLSVVPLSPGIGAIVHGIDMARPTDSQVEQVWLLLMARKVVFFRDQGHISRDQHIAFGKRFAETGMAFGRQQALAANKPAEDHPEILRLYSDEAHPFAAANWHSDVTWSDRPPLGSILLSRKSPPVGGDTMFVDSYAQWNSLSPELKQFLAGRAARHGRAGNDEVEHPICRTHPVTGKSALYINPTFTNSICGMTAEDSARLLAQLYAKMYSTPEFACRFQWQDGSVAMWDNRSCQHYAVADFWPYVRQMERVTLLDASEADEVPFWQDADGQRHYSVLLTTNEAINTPVGASSY